MFYGRENELQQLSEVYHQTKGSLTVIYGRRRIGKSTLLKFFANDKPMLSFEGLEKLATTAQIYHFSKSLKGQLAENQLLQKANFLTWPEIFDFLTTHFATAKPKKKLVLILDEFQWLAAGQSKLVALLKF
jgi:AAA+ ATPase superfamily predicted ATPase